MEGIRGERRRERPDRGVSDLGEIRTFLRHRAATSLRV